MLMKNLKEEYNLRYNIMRYKKLMKRYKYNRFEMNNANLLLGSITTLKQKICN